MIIQKPIHDSRGNLEPLFRSPRQAGMTRPIFDKRFVHKIERITLSDSQPEIIIDRQWQTFVKRADLFQHVPPNHRRGKTNEVAAEDRSAYVAVPRAGFPERQV